MANIRGIHIILAVFFIIFIIIPASFLAYYVSKEEFKPQKIFNTEANLSESLTIPKVAEKAFNTNNAKAPKINSAGADYRGLVFFLSESKLYDEGVEGAFLTIVNNGDKEVFIHSFDLVLKGKEDSVKPGINTSYYLWDGSSLDMGYIGIPDSGKNQPKQYTPCAGIYVNEGGYGENNWSDAGIYCSKEMNLSRVGNISGYKKANVSRADFITESKVKARITPLSQEVRNTVGKIAAYEPGEYNLGQICEAYDWVKENINYVDDPRGTDYWTYPRETIESEVGDCEDQSFLLASIIESMGGTTKIYFTKNHAFTAFYAGNNESVEEIKDAMKEKYDVPEIASIKDKYGDWIILDLTCGYFPGDLPCDAIAINDEVYFINETFVKEVND